MATPSRSGREWLPEPTSAFQMLIMRLNEFEVMHTVSSILSSVNLLSMFLVQLTRICLQNGHTRSNNPFNWGRAWGRTLETILFLRGFQPLSGFSSGPRNCISTFAFKSNVMCETSIQCLKSFLFLFSTSQNDLLHNARSVLTFLRNLRDCTASQPFSLPHQT